MDNRQITSLLISWRAGNRASFEELVPHVEAELRRIAHCYMRRESPNHTLQTTALINEAYLKLVDQTGIDWQNRAHFFGIAANIMRRILLNYARDRVAQKRGGPAAIHVELDEASVFSDERSAELIALDEALERFSKVDRMKSRIVELKWFGGLTAEEISEVTGLAVPTVNLYWRLSKAWLAKEIRGCAADGPS
jgi:RNA polymerase sigma-70 factor, ECF subfamily